MNARNQIISKKTWLGQLSGESPHLVWAELLALFRLSLRGHVWNMLEIYNQKKHHEFHEYSDFMKNRNLFEIWNQAGKFVPLQSVVSIIIFARPPFQLLFL